MSSWGYALLCVVAPTLWGLLIVWAMQVLEKRRATTRNQDRSEDSLETDTAVPDYHI